MERGGTTDGRTMSDLDLHHTYLAALQHDHVDVPEDAVVYGVVRRPLPWLWGEIDDNLPAVAPPESLLDAFKARADEIGHDRAWADLEFERRYRNHLRTSDGAQDTMDELRREARNRPVYLVCYENVEQKRCHRTLLVDELRDE
ncbi:DUF488 domain-containing protein [Haladaptatus sp. NG-WS-4]